MKKLLAVMLLLALSCTAAYAENIGVFAKLNATEAQFEAATIKNESRPNIMSTLFAEGFRREDTSMRFYNTFSQMQMALNRGEIDSFGAPDFLGEYMLRHSDAYTLHGVVLFKTPVALSLGMLKEKSELRDRISTAIRELEASGVIGMLARDFITGLSTANPPAVKIDRFDDAETINVAVTGDVPPLDYIAADGTPSGFNTAILAEIGRKLHVNINLVNIETAARASALASGRVDVVFWFMIYGQDKTIDLPEGIIVSEPYYGFYRAYLISRK